MKLADFPTDGLSFKDLALDKDCSRDIQIRLRDLGILDPPADGDFGPQSQFALHTFAKLVNQTIDQTVTKSLAQALIDTSSASLLPLEPANDLAGRVIKYMQAKDYWIARAPGYLNIVYVEGMNADGALNDDAPNKWNDLRLVIQIKGKKPTIVGSWDATTEPGFHFVFNPMNPGGAARIAFGQYKAWSVGFHNASKPSKHEALVQVDVITVHRDFNKDMKRTGDKTDVGSAFAVNQHQGFNMPPGNIGKSSAGCLVGRTNAGHQEFMKLVKTDPRYKEASRRYKFMTAVIAGDDLVKTIG
ncbi:MAG TPA: hypothetical protein VN282_22845 [Pyrinomonadaceae bacterium]|nr:hypothetical protein [Pyrinomonadaceae bacterium]